MCLFIWGFVDKQPLDEDLFPASGQNSHFDLRKVKTERSIVRVQPRNVREHENKTFTELFSRQQVVTSPDSHLITGEQLRNGDTRV